MGDDSTGRVPRLGLIRVNPHTNEETPTRYGGVTVREYFGRDLDAALAAWGKLDGKAAALDTARRTIAALEAAGGTSIFEVYIQAGRQCVVVVFDSEPGVAAASVHTGYVDHRVRLPGATADGKDGCWRTHLPAGRGPAAGASTRAPATGRASGAAPTAGRSTAPRRPATRRATTPAPAAMVPCPHCFELVPRAGECRCGWRPDGG